MEGGACDCNIYAEKGKFGFCDHIDNAGIDGIASWPSSFTYLQDNDEDLSTPMLKLDYSTCFADGGY